MGERAIDLSGSRGMSAGSYNSATARRRPAHPELSSAVPSGWAIGASMMVLETTTTATAQRLRFCRPLERRSCVRRYMVTLETRPQTVHLRSQDFVLRGPENRGAGGAEFETPKASSGEGNGEPTRPVSDSQTVFSLARRQILLAFLAERAEREKNESGLLLGVHTPLKKTLQDADSLLFGVAYIGPYTHFL